MLTTAGGGVVVVDRGVGDQPVTGSGCSPVFSKRTRALSSARILPSLASMKMGTWVWPYFRSAVMSEAITRSPPAWARAQYQ